MIFSRLELPQGQIKMIQEMMPRDHHVLPRNSNGKETRVHFVGAHPSRAMIDIDAAAHICSPTFSALWGHRYGNDKTCPCCNNYARKDGPAAFPCE